LAFQSRENHGVPNKISETAAILNVVACKTSTSQPVAWSWNQNAWNIPVLEKLNVFEFSSVMAATDTAARLAGMRCQGRGNFDFD
jgi:hypothetical protein